MFEIFKLRYAQKRGEWVFPSRQNEGQHITNMRAGLAALNQNAGTNITTHDLRRTYATIANNLDYSVATIKRLLNHRDSSRQNDVTLRYIQMSTKKLKQAMNDIENQIFEYSGIVFQDVIKKIKAST
nr:tyrosine-type recombinase/integrase [Acinetobacter ursingii]